ncbi:rod shape-determining protein MreC [Opitutaceae bacterium TAV4]|nr:rod shape-determining protein MreC [Opitutaceae bacterium TAV4]RRJ99082.1 rod shape-determining protein MreC [Opitutaceae bacterium TAV3]
MPLRKKRLDQARPYFTLLVVLLAWLLLPAVFKRMGRVSFYELQAPAEAAASFVSDLQEFWSLKTHSKNELIEAGRDLARLNSAYEVMLQENVALRAERARLETLLRLPSFPEYRLEPARVVLRDFTAWWQRLVIRKGSNYGITVGAPVIYGGGVVGRVAEVHAYTSVVEMISSPGVRIAATFEGDTRPVSYQGGINRSFSAPGGVIEFVPLDVFATASAPQRLLTSGIGGVYPPGLFVGEVTSVDPGVDGLFKTGRVRLDPRLNQLAEVTVLVPLGEKAKN